MDRDMKKTAIVFAIGLAVGVASTVIGLRLLSNNPILASEGITASIPGVWGIIFLAWKGFLLILTGAFTIGVLISVGPWWLIKTRRRKKGEFPLGSGDGIKTYKIIRIKRNMRSGQISDSGEDEMHFDFVVRVFPDKG